MALRPEGQVAVMEKRPLGKPEFPTGEHIATCVAAVRETSAAGNRMVVWSFRLPGGQELRHFTVVRRVETGLTAQALGLPLKPLRLVDAPGKSCRVTVAKDGDWHKITGVRPL